MLIDRSSDHIPPLGQHCNSWVITRRIGGYVVGEFYNRKLVACFDPAKVIVETAAQYLGRMNAKIKEESWCLNRRTITY